MRAQSAPVTSRSNLTDIATKTRTVVRQFDGPIEAPNWTPDGKFLVYNSNGLIFRIPAAGGEPQAIDTGTGQELQQRSRASADGKVLAISARGPAGPSQVFWLPITGGEPTLVTPASPSYLHGITPTARSSPTARAATATTTST